MARSPFQPTGDMNLSWRALAARAFTSAADAPPTATLGGWDLAGAAVDLDDPAERRLGDYELLEELGRGGMGVVYRARQRSLDREIALKLLASSLWTSGDAAARFAAEAASAARMQHPNIVAIHEFGTQADRFFYSMELVQGTDLATHLRERGPLAEAAACRLVRELARAVHYAHGLNILHLDLKPQNVLMEADGRPRIADFGLARPLDRAAGEAVDSVAGTPAYMAPEQALLHAADISRATDVYGLGAILYQCLTGAPPFDGDSAEATLRAVTEAPLALPRSRRRSLSRDVEAVCLKCLQRDPAQRYASAEELAEDLGRVLDGNPVQARRLRWTERAWRWLAREPVTLGGLAGAGAILALAVAAWYVQFELTRRSERLAGDAFAAAADALLANPGERAQLEALLALDRAAFPLANQRGVEARIAFHAGLREAVMVRRGPAHPLAHELALYLADDRRERDHERWKAALAQRGTALTWLLHNQWRDVPYRPDAKSGGDLGADLYAALGHPQLSDVELAVAAARCLMVVELESVQWREGLRVRCDDFASRLAQAAQRNAFFRLLTPSFEAADHAAYMALLTHVPLVELEADIYRDTLAALEPLVATVAPEDLANGLSAREIAALAARRLSDDFSLTMARHRALLPCRNLPSPVPAARAGQCRAALEAMRTGWSSWYSQVDRRVGERRLDLALESGSVPRSVSLFDYGRIHHLLACCSRRQTHPEWVRLRATEGDLEAGRWLYRSLGEPLPPMMEETQDTARDTTAEGRNHGDETVLPLEVASDTP